MGLIGSALGGIAGGIVSGIGGIFAGKAANKGYNEALDDYERRMGEIRQHRDKVYYQDPTQSAENQAVVTQAQQLLGEQAKRSAATAAVTGGTAEKEALDKAAATATVGNMLQQQAVNGESRRENAWASADNQLDAFTKYQADIRMQRGLSKAKSISDAANGVAKSATEAGSLLPW